MVASSAVQHPITAVAPTPARYLAAPWKARRWAIVGLLLSIHQIMSPLANHRCSSLKMVLQRITKTSLGLRYASYQLPHL